MIPYNPYPIGTDERRAYYQGYKQGQKDQKAISDVLIKDIEEKCMEELSKLNNISQKGQ